MWRLWGRKLAAKFKLNCRISEIQKLFHKCKATDSDNNSNYLKKMLKTAAHKRIEFSKARV